MVDFETIDSELIYALGIADRYQERGDHAKAARAHDRVNELLDQRHALRVATTEGQPT